MTSERERRLRRIERENQKQHVDIQRLWKRLPHNTYAGEAFGSDIPNLPGPVVSGTSEGSGTLASGTPDLGTGTIQTFTQISGSGICVPCVAFPAAWEFTIAGVSDQDCSGCDNFNGTFVVRHAASCVWNSTETAFDCSGGACVLGRQRYQLTYSNSFAPRGWRLIALMAPSGPQGAPNCLQLDEAAVYDAADDQWDCLGPNVMYLKQNTSGSLDPNQPDYCQGWPDTIVLSPT